MIAKEDHGITFICLFSPLISHSSQNLAQNFVLYCWQNDTYFLPDSLWLVLLPSTLKKKIPFYMYYEIVFKPMVFPLYTLLPARSQVLRFRGAKYIFRGMIFAFIVI